MCRQYQILTKLSNLSQAFPKMSVGSKTNIWIFRFSTEFSARTTKIIYWGWTGIRSSTIDLIFYSVCFGPHPQLLKRFGTDRTNLSKFGTAYWTWCNNLNMHLQKWNWIRFGFNLPVSRHQQQIWKATFCHYAEGSQPRSSASGSGCHSHIS